MISEELEEETENDFEEEIECEKPEEEKPKGDKC